MNPLANRIRPLNFDEVVGQEHILGKDKILWRILKSKNIPNMIFFGPSGTGKTTVANIIANETNRTLYRLNATTASISDIKAIVDELDTLITPNGALLYLDEIQYFNKKQQQSLLEFIENGKITLIASTTENPYFYVYNAILSRSTVFEFKPVSKPQVEKAVCRAIDILKSETDVKFEIEDGVLEYISISCGGDVRKAINAVELLFTVPLGKKTHKVTLEDAEQIAQRSSMRYDKDADVHYDLLSAFQKSIRGSDENAAIYYLARLVAAGDLISICRRLLVIASEDIGLAYPMASAIVKSLCDSAMQIGFPEAQIPLAHAVLLLATSPKSNSAVSAIGSAIEDLNKGLCFDPPDSLKDAHYEGAKKLKRGEGYKYSHDYPNNYVKQQFLPDEIKDRVYYEFAKNKNEQAAKEYWAKIKGSNQTQKE